MKKEEIINSISNRITAELHKHPQLDWADIAARKIYTEHLVKNLSLSDVSNCSCINRDTLTPEARKMFDDIDKALERKK